MFMGKIVKRFFFNVFCISFAPGEVGGEKDFASFQHLASCWSWGGQGGDCDDDEDLEG